MLKSISVVLLVIGVLLIIWGVSVSRSVSSVVSRFFTGSPANRAVWLMAVGIAAAIIGLLLMMIG